MAPRKRSRRSRDDENRLWEAEHYPALLTLYDKRIASLSAAGKQPKEKDAYRKCLLHYTVQRSNVFVKLAGAEPEPTLQEEKWKMAKKDATWSLELEPDCPNALITLAEILIFYNNTTASCKEAVDHLTRALKHPGRENCKPVVWYTATMHRAEALFRLLDDKKLGFSNELYVKAVPDFVRLLKPWDGLEASVYTESWGELKTQLASLRARAAIPRAPQPATARASAASAAPTPGATAGKGGGEGSSSKRKRDAPEQQLGTQGRSGSQDDVAGAMPPKVAGLDVYDYGSDTGSDPDSDCPEPSVEPTHTPSEVPTGVLDAELMDLQDSSNLDIESKRSVAEKLENELEELTREHTQLSLTLGTEDDYNRMDALEALVLAKKAEVEHSKEELRTAEQEAERREEAARIESQMREKAAEEARQKAIAAAAAAAAAQERAQKEEKLKQLCDEKEQLERQLEEHRKGMIRVLFEEKKNYRDKFMRPLLSQQTELSEKISALDAQLKGKA
jgi:hypothetical protein